MVRKGEAFPHSAAAKPQMSEVDTMRVNGWFVSRADGVIFGVRVGAPGGNEVNDPAKRAC